MKDLFEREIEMLEHAQVYAADCLEQNELCSVEEYKRLTKEYRSLLKLLRRVTKVSDMTAVELNADKNKLLDKVNVDALTGIHNRRFFEENSRSIFEECQQHGLNYGMLMLDVDLFKQYNDTYGHSRGDECLQQIAKAIDETIVAEDGFAARYGGEEFVVVIADIDEQELRHIAENILTNIKRLKIEHEKNIEKQIITISIGGSCIRAQEGDDYKECVCIADEGLYQSKKNGRDRYTLCAREGKTND